VLREVADVVESLRRQLVGGTFLARPPIDDAE